MRSSKSEEISVGIEELRKQADGGSAWASLTMGWMYQHGDGVGKNLRDAEECFRKAVLMGHPDAKFYLARFYVEEEHDYARALPLFVDGSKGEHLPSIYWAGRLYYIGEGVDKNMPMAEMFLRRAAEKGHLYARRDYCTGLISGAFGKRHVIKGIIGRIAVAFAGATMMVADPDSELLM